MGSRDSFVTRGMERFSLDLPQAAENGKCAVKVGCSDVFRY